ncbi:MAG: amidohydrolase family protein [Rikenellaceae bacterium]
MNCSKSPRRRIASNLMFVGGEFVSRPLLTLDPEGRILSIESYDQVDRLQNTEFYSGIMTPGFVNAHSHLELSYLKGRIEPYGGFAAFARQIGAVRGEATMEQRICALEREDIKLRSEGVVAVGDVVNGDTSMDCKSRSPINYRNFGELFGLSTTSADHMEWVLNHPNSSLTPHSTYSLGDKLFKAIASRNIDTPLSIHFMESPSEAELYSRSGPLWEWYERVGFECDFLHYGSPAQRIVESVPRERSVMLVHNCCVKQADIDIIMGHFTAPVYWVLCPRSNDYISRIYPPVDLLRSNGLNICLGTDSLASNHSLSIVSEILSLGESVPLCESLDWATRQGAKALGFDELGELKVGKRPGLNILSAIDYKTMQLTPNSVISTINVL